MKNKTLIVTIFLLLTCSVIASANEFNLPPYWLKTDDGTRLDADNDGLIDLSENSNLLGGQAIGYFLSLSQFQTENTSLWLGINNRLLTSTFLNENSSLWTAVNLKLPTATFTAENASVWAAISNVSSNVTGAYLLASDQRYNESSKVASVNISLNTLYARQTADNSTLASQIAANLGLATDANTTAYATKATESANNATQTAQIALRATIASLESNFSQAVSVSVLEANITSVNANVQANETALNDRIDAVNTTANAATNYSQYTNVSNLAINSTTLAVQNGLLNVVLSWFTNLFYTKDEVYNTTQTDAKDTLINDSLNSQIALQAANNITNNAYIATKLDATDQRYNETNLANTKLIDVTSSNSYIGVSGTTNKTLSFSETTLNTTITAALATQYFNATTVETTTGTAAGAIGDLRTYNDISYNVSETNGDLDFQLNFTGVTGVNQFVIRYKTILNEPHEVSIFLWDYDDNNWEGYGLLTSTDANFNIKQIGVFDETAHLNGGLVRMRLNTSNTGASSDKWQFDWITVSKGVATPSSNEIDPLSIHKNGDVPLTNNWNAGDYNISFNANSGVNASHILQPYWKTTAASDLDNATNNAYIATKLDATDQRYNETNALNNQNTSNNAYIATKLDASDQRYNETTAVNTKLNRSGDTAIGTFSINNTLQIGGGILNNGTTITNGDAWIGNDLFLLGDLNALNIQGINMNGSYLPSITNTFTLGDTNHVWLSVYTKNVTATTLYGNLDYTYIQSPPWTLSTTTTNLNASHAALQQTIINLNVSYTDTKQALTNLNASVVNNINALTNLNASHIALQNAVSNLNTSYLTTQGGLANLNSSHIALQGTVSNLNASVVTHATQTSVTNNFTTTNTNIVNNASIKLNLAGGTLTGNLTTGNLSITGKIVQPNAITWYYYRNETDFHCINSTRYMIQNSGGNTSITANNNCV